MMETRGTNVDGNPRRDGARSPDSWTDSAQRARSSTGPLTGEPHQADEALDQTRPVHRGRGFIDRSCGAAGSAARRHTWPRIVRRHQNHRRHRLRCADRRPRPCHRREGDRGRRSITRRRGFDSHPDHRVSSRRRLCTDCRCRRQPGRCRRRQRSGDPREVPRLDRCRTGSTLDRDQRAARRRRKRRGRVGRGGTVVRRRPRAIRILRHHHRRGHRLWPGCGWCIHSHSRSRRRPRRAHSTGSDRSVMPRWPPRLRNRTDHHGRHVRSDAGSTRTANRIRGSTVPGTRRAPGGVRRGGCRRRRHLADSSRSLPI